MGTRADFYVGRGQDAEWLGSIAWDGYPDGLPEEILAITDETAYRAAVALFLKERDDGTVPEMGWPWPWTDSRTTDYAYAIDGERVWASCFGYEWFDPTQPQPEDDDASKSAAFPDMTEQQNVTMGKRSGIMLITSRGVVEPEE